MTRFVHNLTVGVVNCGRTYQVHFQALHLLKNSKIQTLLQEENRDNRKHLFMKVSNTFIKTKYVGQLMINYIPMHMHSKMWWAQ